MHGASRCNASISDACVQDLSGAEEASAGGGRVKLTDRVAYHLRYGLAEHPTKQSFGFTLPASERQRVTAAINAHQGAVSASLPVCAHSHLLSALWIMSHLEMTAVTFAICAHSCFRAHIAPAEHAYKSCRVSQDYQSRRQAGGKDAKHANTLGSRATQPG